MFDPKIVLTNLLPAHIAAVRIAEVLQVCWISTSLQDEEPRAIFYSSTLNSLSI